MMQIKVGREYSLIKSRTPEVFKRWYKIWSWSVKPALRLLCPFPRLHELNKPLFVIGSGRSGTSKLVHTLKLLPNFVPLIEEPTIRHTAWRIAETETFNSTNWKILHKQLIRLSGVTRKKRLLEKTPANSLLACFIGLHARQALFIHAVRDGRDVALSMLDHDWLRHQLLKDYPERYWWKYVDTDFSDRWKNLSAVERGLLRWGVHFKLAKNAQQFRGRYFEMAYETLCYTGDRLIEFVITELSISEVPNEFYDAVKAYTPRSVGRYKNDPNFTMTDQKTFECIASRIGYKGQP